jgi:predicted Holliday junction resolvase-like endonuclease
MDTKKVALIIFLIGVVFLSAGIIIFYSREQGKKNELRIESLNTPKTQEAEKRINEQKQVQEKVITEEQITQKIEETRQQINQKPKGTALSDSDLEFIGSPREAAIKELKK